MSDDVSMVSAQDLNKSLAAAVPGSADPLAIAVHEAHADGLELDDSQLTGLLEKLEAKKKELKKKQREAAEDARRERRGLPRKGEATKEQQERLDEIMSKVDADLVLSFLMMHKPATLIQTISQMERLEFPWNQEEDEDEPEV